jgi:hypothetical protein
MTNCKTCHYDNISKWDSCDHVFFDHDGKQYYIDVFDGNEDFLKIYDDYQQGDKCPNCRCMIGQCHYFDCSEATCAKCKIVGSCQCECQDLPLTEEEKEANSFPFSKEAKKAFTDSYTKLLEFRQ